MPNEECMQGYNLDIKVYPMEKSKGNTLAFASVAVEDLVAIRGVQIKDGSKGPFVSMPQSVSRDGKYHDIAFPLKGDLRKQITEEVLSEYSKAAELSAEKTQSLAQNLREKAAKAAAHNAARPDAPGKGRREHMVG